MSLRDFSNDDIAALQEIVRAVRSCRLNLGTRHDSERAWDAGEDHQAPETYIALPQEEDGVPALEDLGTAGIGSGDEPGSGLCDIYRLIGNALKPVGLSKKVYNLTDAVVPQSWTGVTRDKFGNWIFLSGGSVSKPYIITQRDTFGTGTGTGGGETGLLAAIYYAAYNEFLAQPAEWNGTTWVVDSSKPEEYVKCHFQDGVMFTGDLVAVETISGQKVARNGRTTSHYFDDCTYLGGSEARILLNPFATDNPIVPATVRFGDPPVNDSTVSLAFDGYHQRFTLLQSACP